MRNLRLLLRLNRLELFGINRLLNDPARRRRAKWLVALGAVGGVLILGVIFLYCLGIAYGMRWINALDSFPVLMAALAALTAFVTTIFKSPDALFRTRDTDLLLALPVRTRTVAAARVLKLFGMNLLFTLAILLPSCVAYGLMAHPEAVFYARFALTMLVLPMIPVVAASLIGALTAFAGASLKRLRYAGLTLSFLVMLGMMAGYMYMNFAARDGTVLADMVRGLSGLLSRIYPLAGLYMSAVVLGNAGALLGFVSLSVAAFALASAVFGGVFVRLHSALSAQRQKKRFVLGRQRRFGVRHALLAREWRHYLSVNVYVLNTAFGLVLSLVAVIALAVFVPARTVNALLAGMGLEGRLFALLPFVLALLVSMAPTTACAVSLEGKNLWILKSLPVSAYEALLPKLRLNLQLIAPVALVDALVLARVFEARGPALATLVLMPLAMGVFSALLGLVVNCRLYRFDWTSELKVVKQSAAMAIPVFVTILLTLGGGLLTLKFDALNYQLAPLAFTALLALVSLGLWLLLRARAERWVAGM